MRATMLLFRLRRHFRHFDIAIRRCLMFIYAADAFRRLRRYAPTILPPVFAAGYFRRYAICFFYGAIATGDTLRYAYTLFMMYFSPIITYATPTPTCRRRFSAIIMDDRIDRLMPPFAAPPILMSFRRSYAPFRHYAAYDA